MIVSDDSFVFFVYPFLFDAHRFDELSQHVKQAKAGSANKDVWEEVRFPTHDMLSHVARYVNPADDTYATARMWKLCDNQQQIQGLMRNVEWTLSVRGRKIPFHFGDIRGKQFAVHLALFSSGVGLLTVRAMPTLQLLDDWLDFIRSFRISNGYQDIRVYSQRSLGERGFSPTFPSLAGGVNERPEEGRIFQEVLNAFLKTAAPADEQSQWWKEVYVPGRLLSWAALFLDEVPNDERPQILFKARNFHGSKQNFRPHPFDQRVDEHPALLPFAEQQWFTFSLEGGTFVAFDAPKHFYRSNLRDQLRSQYFLLFLMALHQRFALMKLSGEVTAQWTPQSEVESRAAAFEYIQNSLLTFTARGYFAQVMQQEHYHRVYVKWREIFQVEHLYQEVSGQVREMHGYLLARRTAHLEELAETANKRANTLNLIIASLGLAFAIPALVLSFLGVNIEEVTAGPGIRWRNALLLTVAALLPALLFLLTLVTFLLFKRRQRQREE
ncbi:MAG TPA: hypothetical protein VF591_03440 [Pyrinomonadaceae bacterium]|jgi:hypothetical protein